MNKFIFCFLLVCLVSVSVQALVKRDTPTTDTNQFNDMVTELKKWSENIGDKLKENFNPDKMKEDWQKLSKQIEEGIAKMKPVEAKA